eukprot:m.172953 g.172953  ORF g.172953 m.172953 type:complete len:162 (-) comp25232_c0_seq1:23-508(-)
MPLRKTHVGPLTTRSWWLLVCKIFWCIEMFIASIVHHKVFSYREYLREDSPERRRSPPFWLSLCRMLDIRDVKTEVLDHVKVVASLPGKVTSSLTSSKKPNSSQASQPLLSSDNDGVSPSQQENYGTQAAMFPMQGSGRGYVPPEEEQQQHLSINDGEEEE